MAPCTVRWWLTQILIPLWEDLSLNAGVVSRWLSYPVRRPTHSHSEEAGSSFLHGNGDVMADCGIKHRFTGVWHPARGPKSDRSDRAWTVRAPGIAWPFSIFFIHKSHWIPSLRCCRAARGSFLRLRHQTLNLWLFSLLVIYLFWSDRFLFDFRMADQQPLAVAPELSGWLKINAAIG